jgi:hypothetical protein
MRTYAVIKISVPSTDIDKIQAYIEIVSGGTITTVRQYLDNQVYHLTAAYGPNCVATIQAIGQEEEVVN